MAAISDGTGVKVETKKETANDAMVAQLVKEIAFAGGATTVRGVPLEVKRVEVDAWATKNGEVVAEIADRRQIGTILTVEVGRGEAIDLLGGYVDVARRG